MPSGSGFGCSEGPGGTRLCCESHAGPETFLAAAAAQRDNRARPAAAGWKAASAWKNCCHASGRPFMIS